MTRIMSEGVALPAELEAYPKQNLPDSVFSPYMSKWELFHGAIDQFNGFATECAANGLEIQPIPGAGSCRRPLAWQRQMWYERMRLGATGRKTDRRYKGQVWHLRDGYAQCAVPADEGDFYGSMHGWGLATDYWVRLNGVWQAISLSTRTKMRAVGRNWDVRDTVTSENWHFACLNADKVYGAPEPEPLLEAEPEPVFGDGGLLVLSAWTPAYDPKVLWAQKVLVYKCNQLAVVGTPDGKFGPRTAQAVKNLQLVTHTDAFPVRTDGVIDYMTWNMLNFIDETHPPEIAK